MHHGLIWVDAQFHPALFRGGILKLIEHDRLAHATRSGNEQGAERATWAFRKPEFERFQQRITPGEDGGGDTESWAERVGGLHGAPGIAPGDRFRSIRSIGEV